MTNIPSNATSTVMLYKQDMKTDKKERIAVNGYTHVTATGRHLPSQSCLPSETSERARLITPASKVS